MKRLVWLLLAVVGSALAQVQPVELPVSSESGCCCCERGNHCGMPECAPPPVASFPVLATAPASGTVQLAVQRAAASRNRQITQFYVSLVEPTVASAVPPTSVSTTCVASVPLFKVHCSYLI